MFPKAEVVEKKRWLYGAAGAVAVVGALLVGGATASAQSGPSADCASTNVVNFGTQYFGTEDFGNRLLSTAPTSRVFPLPTSLPPGTYSIESVSYDGYPNRDTVAAQPSEQWFGEFLDANGAVLATTGTTGDIADLVLEATWTGSLGEVTLAGTATQIRTQHAAPGDPSINSVRPVCIGAEPVADESPSTVTVTFEDQSGTAGTIGLVCGSRSESASAAVSTIGLDSIAPNTNCDTSYPIDRECTLSMSPAGIENTVVGDDFRVTIPPEGGVDVLIEIVCPAPAGTTDPGPDDVTTEVGGQVETPADAAVPQPGTPAFTG